MPLKIEYPIISSSEFIDFYNNHQTGISISYRSKEEEQAVINKDEASDLYKRYKLRNTEYMIRTTYDSTTCELTKYAYYTCDIKFIKDGSPHLQEIKPYQDKSDDPFLSDKEPDVKQTKPKVKKIIKKTRHIDDLFID